MTRRKTTKLPIIEFRVSDIYNAVWPRPPKLQKPIPAKVWSARERKLKALWAKSGKEILSGISRITGLPWREDRIIVYLTWGVIPFSDPVTISLRRDITSVFETLVHELIHRHLGPEENWRAIRKAWMQMRRQHSHEVPIAVTHIPIHAVHEILWRQLFPRRVQIIKTELKLPPYLRAWELVDEKGAEQVVKEIFHLKQ